MAYPFAGFGAFLFQNDERPLEDSDSFWTLNPSLSRSRALGSTKDRIVTTSIGSAERDWEAHFEPSRFATLTGMINTQGTFTDWTRPTPDSRTAFLANVTQVRSVAFLCTDGVTRRKIRAKIQLISQ